MTVVIQKYNPWAALLSGAAQTGTQLLSESYEQRRQEELLRKQFVRAMAEKFATGQIDPAYAGTPEFTSLAKAYGVDNDPVMKQYMDEGRKRLEDLGGGSGQPTRFKAAAKAVATPTPSTVMPLPVTAPPFDLATQQGQLQPPAAATPGSPQPFNMAMPPVTIPGGAGSRFSFSWSGNPARSALLQTGTVVPQQMSLPQGSGIASMQPQPTPEPTPLMQPGVPGMAPGMEQFNPMSQLAGMLSMFTPGGLAGNSAGDVAMYLGQRQAQLSAYNKAVENYTQYVLPKIADQYLNEVANSPYRTTEYARQVEAMFGPLAQQMGYSLVWSVDPQTHTYKWEMKDNNERIRIAGENMDKLLKFWVDTQKINQGLMEIQRDLALGRSSDVMANLENMLNAPALDEKSLKKVQDMKDKLKGLVKLDPNSPDWERARADLLNEVNAMRNTLFKSAQGLGMDMAIQMGFPREHAQSLLTMFLQPPKGGWEEGEPYSYEGGTPGASFLAVDQGTGRPKLLSVTGAGGVDVLRDAMKGTLPQRLTQVAKNTVDAVLNNYSDVINKIQGLSGEIDDKTLESFTDEDWKKIAEMAYFHKGNVDAVIQSTFAPFEKAFSDTKSMTSLNLRQETVKGQIEAAKQIAEKELNDKLASLSVTAKMLLKKYKQKTSKETWERTTTPGPTILPIYKDTLPFLLSPMIKES